ncbi:MAG: DNA polymerase III subunit delta' [Alphaproteobacteria bacterium]|nr:DNA polymerase III subunit delta' [Alphaproteobacteria bacterium]
MTEDGDDPYLPARNPFLFGQEAAERVLLTAWRSGRMPHAWLLTGPRGAGKATLAHRFARFVLSGGPVSPGGEGLAVDPSSPGVRRVLSGSHPDLRIVARSPNAQGRLRQEIVVDDVRALGQFLHMTPGAGGWRVAIVDAADDLNRNAANALLKVLEEPPRQALLLLTSHSPGRLLATIRSRCRRLPLSPLPAAAVVAALRRLRPDVGSDAATALAVLADGSIGRAVELADKDGVAAWGALIALFSAWPRLDLPPLIAWAERFTRAGQGDGFTVAAELLLAWIARVAATAGGRPMAEAVAGEHAVVARLAGGARLDRWVTLWEKTSDLFARADGLDLDRKHVLLSALLAFDPATAR